MIDQEAKEIELQCWGFRSYSLGKNVRLHLHEDGSTTTVFSNVSTATSKYQEYDDEVTRELTGPDLVAILKLAIEHIGKADQARASAKPGDYGEYVYI